jgi:adenosylcobinamide-GDP ribazoletransferase
VNGLVRALGLFSIVPVRAVALTRADAVAALRWLPALGALLGAVAALPLSAVLEWTPRAALVGAVLSIGVLALLTRALHLDGLADTMDGLGSRAPAAQALEIMRRSDIGPFGVLAIAFAVLIDIAALAALDGTVWRPMAALVVAAATGRVAALMAAHRRVPAARESGFGAHVAGSAGTPLIAAALVAVLGLGAVLAWASDADPVGWPAAQAAALLLAAGFQQHVIRRVGGVTGDVFGALVEIGTALTLAGIAVS